MAPVIALVDLSNASLNAAKYAADMAAALRGRLVLVHVVQLAEVCLSLSTEDIESYKTDEKRIAWLTELRKHLHARTDNTIEIESIILHGEPASELNKFCALQKPLVLITAPATDFHITHIEKSIDISNVLADIEFPLLITPLNSFYNRFKRVTIAIHPGEKNTGDIISSVRKWLDKFGASHEADIHVTHFVSFAANDLISKYNADLLVNATHDDACLDALLNSIQLSQQADGCVPAILLMGTPDLHKDDHEEKEHDCSVCNGACRTRKNLSNSTTVLK